ncbi:hypothetical protein BKA69DRAFT_547894 [Paraphysoderma sedebokerense]|nr:hypothetical protein BKA69DRAFT_547894 [Paraphysoderma sedebokerense]
MLPLCAKYIKAVSIPCFCNINFSTSPILRYKSTMKPTTATLSLFLCWAFLVSMANAAPQQPKQPAIGPITAKCTGALTNSVQTIISSCVNDLTPLALAPIPTNPEDQLRAFFNGTTTLCGEKCLGTFNKAVDLIDGNCSTAGSPDENVKWFFKHAQFGGKALCTKDGNQLCVNRAVEQAKGVNLATDVLPLVQSLASSINMGDLMRIPQSNPDELFNIGFNFMDRMLTSLPPKVLCGNCQTNMGFQVLSYFNNVYKPDVVDRLKMPDPSPKVTSLLVKAAGKCSASSAKTAESAPAKDKKRN